MCLASRLDDGVHLAFRPVRCMLGPQQKSTNEQAACCLRILRLVATPVNAAKVRSLPPSSLAPRRSDATDSYGEHLYFDSIRRIAAKREHRTQKQGKRISKWRSTSMCDRATGADDFAEEMTSSSSSLPRRSKLYVQMLAGGVGVLTRVLLLLPNSRLPHVSTITHLEDVKGSRVLQSKLWD